MDDRVLWQGLVLMQAGALVVLWRLYVRACRQRDSWRGFADGWRNVAERALLVAQIGRNVTRRAAKVAAVVSKP